MMCEKQNLLEKDLTGKAKRVTNMTEPRTQVFTHTLASEGQVGIGILEKERQVTPTTVAFTLHTFLLPLTINVVKLVGYSTSGEYGSTWK